MEKNINTPAISVVMAVYNGEKYLKEAIESILNQTFKDFEFIIIDDASTDESRNIILSYTDSRITLISNNFNVGQTKSLNHGIKIAQGRYIARMDADDISFPKRLEIQYSYLEKHTDIGFCGSSYKILGTNKIIASVKSSEKIKVNLFFGHNCIAHPSVLIRKEVFSKFKHYYNEDNFVNQDYELWSEIYTHIKPSNVSETLLEYRIHSEQITNKRYHEQQENLKRIVLMQLNFLKINPTHEQQKLHLILINKEKTKSITEIEAVNKWANYLKEKNIENPVFNKEVFNKHLTKLQGKSLFTNNFFIKKNYSPSLLIPFFFSKLDIYKYFSFTQNIKFLFKCLFFYTPNISENNDNL